MLCLSMSSSSSSNDGGEFDSDFVVVKSSVPLSFVRSFDWLLVVVVVVVCCLLLLLLLFVEGVFCPLSLGLSVASGFLCRLLLSTLSRCEPLGWVVKMTFASDVIYLKGYCTTVVLVIALVRI
jgi:hypothetical protein